MSALAGVYKGSESLDFTEYKSFGDLLHNHAGDGKELTPLTGNKYNYFWNKDIPDDPDYIWYLEDGLAVNPLILEFQKGFNLNNDEAIYIVVRNTPPEKPSTNETSVSLYKNSLQVKVNENDSWFNINMAEYYYHAVGAVFKDGKRAFIYDSPADSFTNVSTIEEDRRHTGKKNI